MKVFLFALFACVSIAAQAQGAKLMIFGGPGHDTYLGCITCSQYEYDSILNEYGPHGGPYGSESILNKYSDFGSKYSAYGACNKYASDPPVIVDGNGKYYGKLTLNKYEDQVDFEPVILWLRGVCQGQ